MDFSCYVTVFNFTSYVFTRASQTEPQGVFDPSALPVIPASSSANCPGMAFFSLTGDGGTEGSVTYQSGAQQSVTLAFSCPMLSDNTISVPFNNSSFVVSYYGTTTPVQWMVDGAGWPPEGTFPGSGHPLFALFVIEDQPGVLRGSSGERKP